MDSYIKTIINGIKSFIISEVTRLNKLVSNAQSTADTAQSTADTAQSTAEGKAERIDPVFSGSFSQNRKAETTVGADSHAEGFDTIATGHNSHAEGNNTTASGDGSHAEGFYTIASGQHSHAEGNNTTASGYGSHAEGNNTTASGQRSHAEGFYTIASGQNSHVQGKYNKEDTDKKYAHIVGNGAGIQHRSNAHTLDWDGVPWFQGRPQFGGTAQDDGSQAVMANGDTEITLKSPAGKLYKITVSDDGTLTTTEVTT